MPHPEEPYDHDRLTEDDLAHSGAYGPITVLCRCGVNVQQVGALGWASTSTGGFACPDGHPHQPEAAA